MWNCWPKSPARPVRPEECWSHPSQAPSKLGTSQGTRAGAGRDLGKPTEKIGRGSNLASRPLIFSGLAGSDGLVHTGHPTKKPTGAEEQSDMAINQSLLGEFDHEMANTRKSLERVPDAKFDWKPHAKSMTLGRLATHIASIPQWGKLMMETTNFDVESSGRAAGADAGTQNQGRSSRFLRSKCAGSACGDRSRVRPVHDDALEPPQCRKDGFHFAAHWHLARDGHEPHDSPSGTARRLSAAQRCACAFDLRAFGRRTRHVENRVAVLWHANHSCG